MISNDMNAFNSNVVGVDALIRENGGGETSTATDAQTSAGPTPSSAINIPGSSASNNDESHGDFSLLNDTILGNSGIASRRMMIFKGMQLPGECFSDQIDGADYYVGLSNYRLLIVGNKQSSFVCSVPNLMMEAVDVADSGIFISCRDGRKIRVPITDKDSTCLWLKKLMRWTHQPRKYHDIFAFSFYAAVSKQKQWPAWLRRATPMKSALKRLEEEFTRLRLSPSYRISAVNVEFKLCGTYPQHLIFPASLTDEDLMDLREARTGFRIPTVAWASHKTGRVLLRASQPSQTLWTVFTNVKDLKLVKAYQEAQLKIAAANSFVYLDLRAYSAAFANFAKGGGYEGGVGYFGNVLFMGMPNIHNVRYSFHQLRQLLNNKIDPNLFLQTLQSTNWLQMIMLTLEVANQALDHLHGDESVLVHCTDGWDRTSQVTSLIMLVGDSYYRTFEGFENLVQRQWVEFGHQFGYRGCALNELAHATEVSPIFLQFLDCVFQLLQKNPNAFEFNRRYLVKLAQHIYSGLFSTFLFTTLREAALADCVEITDPSGADSSAIGLKCFSIWDYLGRHNTEFINPLYTPVTSADQQRRLNVPKSLKELDLWREAYCCTPIQEILNNSDACASTITSPSAAASMISHHLRNGDGDDACSSLVPASNPNPILTSSSSPPTAAIATSGVISPLTTAMRSSVALSGAPLNAAESASTESRVRTVPDHNQSTSQLHSDSNNSDSGGEQRQKSADLSSRQEQPLKSEQQHEQKYFHSSPPLPQKHLLKQRANACVLPAISGPQNFTLNGADAGNASLVESLANGSGDGVVGASDASAIAAQISESSNFGDDILITAQDLTSAISLSTSQLENSLENRNLMMNGIRADVAIDQYRVRAASESNNKNASSGVSSSGRRSQNSLSTSVVEFMNESRKGIDVDGLSRIPIPYEDQLVELFLNLQKANNQTRHRFGSEENSYSNAIATSKSFVPILPLTEAAIIGNLPVLDDSNPFFLANNITSVSNNTRTYFTTNPSTSYSIAKEQIVSSSIGSIGNGTACFISPQLQQATSSRRSRNESIDSTNAGFEFIDSMESSRRKHDSAGSASQSLGQSPHFQMDGFGSGYRSAVRNPRHSTPVTEGESEDLPSASDELLDTTTLNGSSSERVSNGSETLPRSPALSTTSLHTSSRSNHSSPASSTNGAVGGSHSSTNTNSSGKQPFNGKKLSSSASSLDENVRPKGQTVAG